MGCMPILKSWQRLPTQQRRKMKALYLEQISEEKEKTSETEADAHPPTYDLEMQKLSKRMRGQNKRVSLEVVDEKVI